ncbi:kynureninase [Haematobacter massiliensis]|uniref:Kynureninase n=1 Tax=Haematobacter massiliensis TaxID=195105 RepID=A0A086YA41_9RHOB|nr:kynureninase [Haematobacter massiliensis]KFI31141.1 kynureninase [Haematobacter massiliensis]OWJ69688.1 kynureninase [Haematobacter massiliensis]OWJ88732.1 kynureninase [Haematobacter massiliensis]QBJ23221.1 kynureninase [Haematobacter massiliensis]
MTDFNQTRAAFDLPEGVIYLDGNSLGPLPRGAAERVGRMMTQEWGSLLIRGWNEAGWYVQPRRVGDRIAPLIGAEPGSVVMGDTLSIKVFQALSAAVAMRPGRRVILSDSGNFPSDLYVAQELVAALDRGLELRIVAPEEVETAIDDTLAATLLTEVDYRTGRLHDMAALTARAHAAGALAIWDLAHSAGALPVHLAEAGADFAVGCTYKYLNGGPGAPAFIYVAPRHAETARPALAGWMGHAAPFAFDPRWIPASGIERMRVGTPPVLGLTALEAALDIWEGVSLDAVRRESIRLSEAFIAAVATRLPGLPLASPRAPEHRGSQVSFRHPEAYAIVQALIARGVIGDFRAPDIMRFGFTPLYLTLAEVEKAAGLLADVVLTEAWNQPEFRVRAQVT